MNEVQVERSARIFAAATLEAREMAKLMTQSFEARIKSNDHTFKQLQMCGLPAHAAAKFLGKKLTVTVWWGACGGVSEQMFCWYETQLDGQTWYLLVNDDTIKDVFTQRGLAPKMFKAWKTAKDNS